MALFLGLLVSCAPADAPLHADKLTISESGGWGGRTSITLLPDGSGSYTIDEWGSPEKVGQITVGAEKFREVITHLDGYHRLAIPDTEKNWRDLMMKGWCAPGHRITDMNIIVVTWKNDKFAKFYYVDLGCDPELHQARNDDLRQVINDLAASARPPINR